MQSSNSVSGVSFRQDLRNGQRQVFEHPELLGGKKLNVKLPTGYGKTFTACGVYSIRQHHQLASRLLYVVPSVGQLNQFIATAPQDLTLSSVKGPRAVTDIGLLPGHIVLRRHRKNESQVFATTIQNLIQGGFEVCRDLMEQGQWMLCTDEYHHYGIDKAWGQKTASLPFNFLLAMSATPYRPKEDSAFGEPHVVVTYREAYEEDCVKSLTGHAYNYKIDTIDEEGNLTTYTTGELIAEVGSDAPENIEKFLIRRKMRWSPKYVSPLIDIPIRRMQTARTATGRHKLQTLVSAMCVSHAELVCSQIRGMFSELNVDWVGSGPNGRTNEENETILKKFCPNKPVDQSTKRLDPELDVLVHVGMAGEGLDTTNVSEVVFLRTASFNNTTFQIIGRASRFLSDDKKEPIEANISFDASTELSRGQKQNGGDIIYGVGSALMDAMDLLPPIDGDEPQSEDSNDNNNDDDEFPPELPDEPAIIIIDMDLIGIDSGDAGVQLMAKLIERTGDPLNGFIDFTKIKTDKDHPDWLKIIELYRKMLSVEADQYNERSVIAQWQDSVASAVSNATGIALALMRQKGTRVERSLAGDIKKRINGRKKLACGPISTDIAILKQHYSWTQAFAKDLRTKKELPSWLT